MRAPALLLVTALAAAAGACNSYDPDLGAVPFRCGTDEPRCPLGYTCVSYSADEELCEKTEGEIDGGDGAEVDSGGDFTCADDGELEPNDEVDDATNTFIPSMRDTYKLVNLSICPATDADYFLFLADVPNKNLRADLTSQSGGGPLVLEVLSEGAQVIKSGETVDGMPDLVRAEIPNLAVGTYYVLVRGPGDIENNYTIEITLSEG